jgi:hypothetical protein
MQLTSEKKRVEHDKVDLCVSIVPVAPSVARSVLRKHRKDIQEAVNACRAGDRGTDVWGSRHRETPEAAYGEGTVMTPTTAVIPSTATLSSSSSAIDLTDVEDDMAFTLLNKVPWASAVSHDTRQGMVLGVKIRGNALRNDLISCISDHLNEYTDRWTKHQVIITPSEVIGFQLRRVANPPASSRSSPDPFAYPKTIYLDRFLAHNLELTNSKKRKQMVMLREIRELKTHKEFLTNSNVSPSAFLMMVFSAIF